MVIADAVIGLLLRKRISDSQKLSLPMGDLNPI